MKSRDADILIVPGIGGGLGPGGPTIWYRRWSKSLLTATIVDQADWDTPAIAAWTARLTDAIAAADRPVVLVGHSAGALTIAHAFAGESDPGLVQGAFLVTPSHPDEAAERAPAIAALSPVPSAPLPFPSMLIASRTDPYCRFETANDMGLDWGSAVADAGDAGHINMESGHGPWPEGLMMFSRFLARL